MLVSNETNTSSNCSPLEGVGRGSQTQLQAGNWYPCIMSVPRVSWTEVSYSNNIRTSYNCESIILLSPKLLLHMRFLYTVGKSL